MMNSRNARQRLLAIVPQLNDWQTLFLLKFAEVFEWLAVLTKHSKSDSTHSNLPILRITPVVPGSGFKNTALEHDAVLTDSDLE